MFLGQLVLLIILCKICVSRPPLGILCPVSRSPVYSRDGSYHYPMEVYFPTVRYESNISCIKEQVKQEIVSCPTKSMGCPLIKDNIIDALSTSKSWPKLTSFCPLKKLFHDKSINSRIIVLGGSVTLGVDAIGCCKEPDCWILISRRCSWVYHLDGWLHATFGANISVINTAVGGTNSILASEIIDSILTDIGVAKFTSKDVLLLDFSVNDNIESIPIKDIKMKQGLEKLVRLLISKSASANDMPTIILLETTIEVVGPPENSYHHVYRAIAQHYGLHLFSYADAVLSQNSRVNQAAYHDYLSFKGTYNRHPPWYGQLLYADFIAGMLLYHMNRCENTAAISSSMADRSGINRRNVKPKPKAKPNDGSGPALPALLVPNDDISYVCLADTPPLVKMSYKEIVSNSSVGTFGTSPSNTWQVALDRKNRGGFIMKITPGSTYSNVHDAKLVFPLGITVGQLRNMSVLLQVQYMRSYVDAGMVSLGFCGVFFKNLDALWTDYQKYRYTLQDVYSAKVMLEWCTRKKNDVDMVDFTVMYKVTSRPEDNLNMTHLMLKEPRRNQLFKLVSVLICHVSQFNT